MFGSVALSILASGAAPGHYLLQILPLVTLLVALGFGTPKGRPAGTALLLGLFILIVGASLMRFGGSSVERVRKGLIPPGRSSLQQAADLIRADQRGGDLVYAPKRHLIYWYLDQRPPSVVVHPSALVRDAIMAPLVAHGYVSEDEQQRILEQDFGYVVMDRMDEPWYLSPEQRHDLDRLLKHPFYPWQRSGPIVIYKRQ